MKYLKMAKSDRANNLSTKKLEKLQNNIITYAAKHNFHEIVPKMLHDAWSKNSDDPIGSMIDFLAKVRKSQTYNTYSITEQYEIDILRKEIEEKDEKIQTLNERIAYLEKQCLEYKLQPNINVETFPLSSSISDFTSIAEIRGVPNNLIASADTVTSLINDDADKNKGIKELFQASAEIDDIFINSNDFTDSVAETDVSNAKTDEDVIMISSSEQINVIEEKEIFDLTEHDDIVKGKLVVKLTITDSIDLTGETMGNEIRDQQEKVASEDNVEAGSQCMSEVKDLSESSIKAKQSADYNFEDFEPDYEPDE